MSRNIIAAAACAFALWCLPQAAVAQLLGGLLGGGRPAPAPELDMGLVSFIMVGAVASLAYWRKRKS
jgi:hypothetical protein